MSTPVPWGDTKPSWMIGQVKHLGSVTLGKMLQTKDTGQDVLAPYMRAANAQPDGVLSLDDVKKMWFSPSELDDLTLRQGDVVVVEGGQGGFGRAAYVAEDLDGWGFQNSINRIRPNADNDGRFLTYYLIALRATGFIRRYCNIVSMPHLTAEKLAAIPLPLPSGSQQRAIGDHLDRETAEIDSLIAAQERFVRRLHERRDGLIEHYVLRGIDPLHVGADSPVPFLPVGRNYEVVLGKMLDAGKEVRPTDKILPYIRAANIQDSGLVLDDVKEMPYSPSEIRRLDLRAGDVLVVEGGSVGTSVVLGKDMPGWSFQKTVNRARPTGEVDPRFLAYTLRIYRDRGIISVLGNKSTIAHFTAEKLRALRVPSPPLGDQRRTADHLDGETAKINKLIAKTQRHMELAKERRIALITAGVTGQIDITKGA
ncbi:restriction endonuclease subunit S [Streptomyces albidoflavus]